MINTLFIPIRVKCLEDPELSLVVQHNLLVFKTFWTSCPLNLKHVLTKVDKSYFAISKKSRFKFLPFTWPCCQMQHIQLFMSP